MLHLLTRLPLITLTALLAIRVLLTLHIHSATISYIKRRQCNAPIFFSHQGYSTFPTLNITAFCKHSTDAIFNEGRWGLFSGAKTAPPQPHRKVSNIATGFGKAIRPASEVDAKPELEKNFGDL